LGVEIAYTGDKFTRPDSEQYKLNTAEDKVLKMVQTDLFPHLDWMTNLRSLALVKLGDFTTPLEEWELPVRSHLLEALLRHLFRSPERSPDLLQHLYWIYFEVNNFPGIWETEKSAAGHPLKSFYALTNTVWLVDQNDPETRFRYEEHFISRDQRFDYVEHLGEISVFPDVYTPETDRNLIRFLPNLKYVRLESYAHNDGAQVYIIT